MFLLDSIYGRFRRQPNALPYDLRFQKMGFSDILQNLDGIEMGIIEDISRLCRDFLEKRNALIKGDHFELDGEQYRVYTEFLKGDRILFIKFLPIVARGSPAVSRKIDVNGFGAVKTLVVEYPFKIRKGLSKFSEQLADQITFAYLSLEKRFQASIEPLGKFLFNGLYDILHISMARHNKQQLLSKAYFSVTVRSNKKFRYFLDHSNLDLVIGFLKSRQIATYSPLEVLASILSTEATDTLNTLIDVEEGEFDCIESSEFVSRNDDIKFWAAESLLVDNEQLSSFTILKTDKLIFQLNCPAELAGQFYEVFSEAKPSLSSIFKENASKYKKHATELLKFPNPSLSPALYQRIADWLGTFVGSAVYQVIKRSSG